MMNSLVSTGTDGSPDVLVDVAAVQRWLSAGFGAGRRRAWARSHRALSGWTPDELVKPVGSPRTDAMQAALVAIAQGDRTCAAGPGADTSAPGDDGAAAVLLLAQLSPGLAGVVRATIGVTGWSRTEAIDEVRASFYETVCRHRLDRRPRKIAANLVLDTRQRVLRRRRPSDRVGGELPTSLGSRRPDDPIATAVALTNAIDVVAAAVDHLPGSVPSRRLTAAVAYRAWFLEQPRNEIAVEVGLGPANVNTRLHRLRATIDRAALL
jgi:hypothetical protein